MPRIPTNLGQKIGFDEQGGGDAMPIVFLHGVGSDKSVWHPQLEHFGRTRRAIAFDYPGYGESDSAPEDMTRDGYARAILGAMSVLGIERAHVCGLSLGGVVAIAMHHAQGSRCASLILADTFAVHPEGRAIYERSLLGSSDLPAMAEARVDLLLARNADRKVRGEVVETMSRIDPGAYRVGAGAVWLADQRERAGEVRVPSLVIVGDQDFVTPVDLSNELVDLIPDARMQVIRDAGHLANLEQADEFNRAIEDFLEIVE